MITKESTKEVLKQLKNSRDINYYNDKKVIIYYYNRLLKHLKAHYDNRELYCELDRKLKDLKNKLNESDYYYLDD